LHTDILPHVVTSEAADVSNVSNYHLFLVSTTRTRGVRSIEFGMCSPVVSRDPKEPSWDPTEPMLMLSTGLPDADVPFSTRRAACCSCLRRSYKIQHNSFSLFFRKSVEMVLKWRVVADSSKLVKQQQETPYRQQWTAAERSMQMLMTISVVILNWWQLHAEVCHRDIRRDNGVLNEYYGHLSITVIIKVEFICQFPIITNEM